jgi:hypothetical protein
MAGNWVRHVGTVCESFLSLFLHCSINPILRLIQVLGFGGMRGMQGVCIL